MLIQLGEVLTMKPIVRLVAAVGLVATLCSGTAQATPAATLSFADGADSTLSGIGFNPTWMSGFGTADYNLTAMRKGGVLSLSSLSNVTYTFVGKEAGYNNSFLSFVTSYGVDGQTLVGTNGNLGTSILFGNVGAGTLNYGFKSNGTGATYFNGNAATGLVLAKDKKSALILFNDAYPGDKDFDDMVVRVSVLAVPEPETYGMLLAGLGVIGTIVRRRRNRS